MINLGYVYCLYDAKNKICRIGLTNIEEPSHCRVKSQQSYYPFPLTSLKIRVWFPLRVERHLHETFGSKKLNGDWFEIKPENFQRELDNYLDWQKKVGLRNLSINEAKGIVNLVYPSAILVTNRLKTKNAISNYSVLSEYSRNGKTISTAENKINAWQAAVNSLNLDDIKKGLTQTIVV